MTVIVEVKKTMRSLVSMFQIAANIRIKKIDKKRLMMRIDTLFLLMSPSNLDRKRPTALPAKKRISKVTVNKMSVLIAY